jgi:hypothetical protein
LSFLIFNPLLSGERHNLKNGGTLKNFLETKRSTLRGSSTSSSVPGYDGKLVYGMHQGHHIPDPDVAANPNIFKIIALLDIVERFITFPSGQRSLCYPQILSLIQRQHRRNKSKRVKRGKNAFTLGHFIDSWLKYYFPHDNIIPCSSIFLLHKRTGQIN